MASSLTLRIGADIKELNARLLQAEKRLKRFGFKAEKIGRDLTTRVTLPIVGIGVAAVKSFAQFDRIQKGLAALAGSTQAGADQFQRLNKIVLDTRTTLDLKTAALGAQRLQTAGQSAAEAERTIRQLGIAATVSGASIDDVGGVVRQFGQILGKGKFEQEDFNSILDRVPALGAVIRKEFGGATAEQIRATGVSAEDFVRRTVDAIEQTENFQNIQGGLAKSFESFANSVVVGIAPLGKAIADSLNLEENLKRLGDAITNASQKFANLGEGTQRFIVLSAAAVAAVGPLFLGLGAVAKALPLLRSGFGLVLGPLSSVRKLLVKATKSLAGYTTLIVKGGAAGRTNALTKAVLGLRNALAILTGPIGLIVAAIALIVISFKKAYDNSATFRNQITLLGRAFKPITDGFKSLANKILPDLDINLSSIGDVFNLVFAGISAGISFIITSFTDFVTSIKLVGTAIQQVVNFEFGAAAETLADTIFNPATFIKSSKNAAENAVKVFNETLEGRGPSSYPGDDDDEGGGGNGKTKKVTTGLGRSSQVVDKLSTSIGDLVGNYERASIAALALAASNDSVAKKARDMVISIAPGPLDAYRESMALIDEKSEAFGASFDTVGAQIKATESAINALVEDGYPAYRGEIQLLKGELEKLNETQDKNNQSTNDAESSTKLFGDALRIIGLDVKTFEEALEENNAALVIASATLSTTLVAAFDDMARSGKSFAQSLVQATRQIVGAFIKQGVAALVSRTLQGPIGLSGPLALPIAAAAGAGASALFSSLLNKINIPALAEGGIATGATLALIGEGRESEAILPLSKLQGLLDMKGGMGGQVRFEISGDTLVGVLDIARDQQNRMY